MNNELKEIGREPTKQENKYIKRTAVVLFCLGVVLTIISIVFILLAAKEYAYDGRDVEDPRSRLNFIYIIFICIFSIIGVSLLRMGTILLINIKNIMVTQVEVVRTYMELFNLFYTGEYKYTINDRIKTKYANVAYEKSLLVKNDRHAILYFIPDKDSFYLLGRCMDRY